MEMLLQRLPLLQQSQQRGLAQVSLPYLRDQARRPAADAQQPRRQYAATPAEVPNWEVRS